MSELSKKLRELATAELDGMVEALIIRAGECAPASITESELLRIAAGGKTQVLRNQVIKRLSDAMEAKMLGKLADESDE